MVPLEKSIDHNFKQRVICKITLFRFIRFLDFGPYITYICVNGSRLALCTLWHDSLAYTCLVVHIFLVNVFFSPLVRSYPLWWWWWFILPVSCFPVIPSCRKLHIYTLHPLANPLEQLKSLKKPKTPTTKPSKKHPKLQPNPTKNMKQVQGLVDSTGFMAFLVRTIHFSDCLGHHDIEVVY